MPGPRVSPNRRRPRRPATAARRRPSPQAVAAAAAARARATQRAAQALDPAQAVLVSALRPVLGATRSRAVLRSGRVTSEDLTAFRALAALSFPAARAWVNRTHVPVPRALRMQQWGVRASTVADWVAVDSTRRPADIYPQVAAAVVAGLVVAEDVNGWLTVATEHEVMWRPGEPFLGAEVNRLAAARMSPAEAGRFLADPSRDWAAVDLLAGLV